MPRRSKSKHKSRDDEDDEDEDEDDDDEDEDEDEDDDGWFVTVVLVVCVAAILFYFFNTNNSNPGSAAPVSSSTPTSEAHSLIGSAHANPNGTTQHNNGISLIRPIGTYSAPADDAHVHNKQRRVDEETRRMMLAWPRRNI